MAKAKSTTSVPQTQKRYTAAELTPKVTVGELDRWIIGQKDAKRATAIALRNRFRRMKVREDFRDEIIPKNILMIGPTGVGKTEISRRIAKMVHAPFVKVEATKFTEVGYVGKEVESIIKDLMANAIEATKKMQKEEVREQAEEKALERVVTAVCEKGAPETTRMHYAAQIQNGQIDDREITIKVKNTGAKEAIDEDDLRNGQIGIHIQNMMNNAVQSQQMVDRVMTVKKAMETCIDEESAQLIDSEKIAELAIENCQNNGIVFIDEIDKTAMADHHGKGGGVSREGVQRDLLPLIEGTTVQTKYGPVKTDHILFICSGAFANAKPSDLLPELQGRLPIRVVLRDLKHEDFVAILSDTDASIIKQYKELLATEGVELAVDDSAIDRIAYWAVEINSSVENIGARRLHTIMERVLEEISFEADEKPGKYKVNAKFIDKHIGDLADNADLRHAVI